MTMNSERQPEPTVLLLAILINSSVLYGSPGNENACVRILKCMCVFHLPALISIGFWGGCALNFIGLNIILYVAIFGIKI